jgi:hypothetical protein
MPLCGYLSAAGATLIVSDIDANRSARAAATYGATVTRLKLAPARLGRFQCSSSEPAAERPGVTGKLAA